MKPNEDSTGSPLETLSHIRSMMERASKFTAISGLSGVVAGFVALIGAWMARQQLDGYIQGNTTVEELRFRLLCIALAVIVIAFASGLWFTLARAKQEGRKLLDPVGIQLLTSWTIPMLIGGFFSIGLIRLGFHGLIAPSMLLFYGLALVSASKYTVQNIQWLGYSELLLGLLGLWWIGNGLLFWSIGFGVLHIVYGAAMYWKYERNSARA